MQKGATLLKLWVDRQKNTYLFDGVKSPARWKTLTMKGFRGHVGPSVAQPTSCRSTDCKRKSLASASINLEVWSNYFKICSPLRQKNNTYKIRILQDNSGKHWQPARIIDPSSRFVNAILQEHPEVKFTWEKAYLPLFHSIVIEIRRTRYSSSNASRYDVSWRPTTERNITRLKSDNSNCQWTLVQHLKKWNNENLPST